MADKDFPIKDASGLLTRTYDDLVHPGAAEIGKTVHRAIRVALSPVNGTLWTIEQAIEWVELQATTRLGTRGVRPEDVVAPTPEVLGTILVGVQIASAGGELRD